MLLRKRAFHDAAVRFCYHAAVDVAVVVAAVVVDDDDFQGALTPETQKSLHP